MKHIALLCCALLSLAAAARAEGDRDVVSVNGTIIRQSEVMERLWNRFGPATLEEMVDEILLRQASKEKGLKAEEKEISKRLALLKERYPDQALFEAALKKSGTSLEKLKKEISDQLLIRQLIISSGRIAVKDPEVQQAFQAQKDRLATPPGIHLHQILVKTEAEAKDVMAKVKAGADFTALARQVSLAPSGPAKGGDYGFVSKGMLPEEIEQIAFSLKAGEMRLLPTEKGFHVLRVSEKRGAQPAQFSSVKDDLKEMLLEQKMQEALPGLTAELRKKADIKPLGSL